jgi:hypothetical protein
MLHDGPRPTTEACRTSHERAVLARAPLLVVPPPPPPPPPGRACERAQELASLFRVLRASLLDMYSSGSRTVLLMIVIAGIAFFAGRRSASPSHTPKWTGAPTSLDLECLPFLPELHATLPPAADDPLLQRAGACLRTALDARFEATGLDALSLAVFTSAGNIFEGHWGVLRANGSSERAASPPVDAHSEYRVASVSKLLIAARSLNASSTEDQESDEAAA